MPQPRVIKRYANRKLYDTQRSRYVTLDQISEMIRDGEDVQIVDNNTKEDLTSVTLAQIIFEEEKKQKSFLPLHAMRHLIQSGGESIQEFVAQAGGKVRSAFRRDRRPDEGAAAEVPGEAPAEEAAVEKPKVEPAAAVREFLEGSQKTFDEWQKRVDERIRHAVEAISPFSTLQKEVQALAGRLEELEKRLEAQSAQDKDGV
ncbi:MAG: polyhydroxyalkanoate synthesis regulator DNA-binding domain-containing protein [Deltaproteobacteria bacterium]|nr:polyhydroxyalkanoate synthesis regulator DNA-binding domain-containing protein [Deltaproteobacteria bacterium]